MQDIEISQDQVKFTLAGEGYSVEEINIKPADQANLYQGIEGLNGRRHQGSTYEAATIEVKVSFKTTYELDMPLKRDKLTTLLTSSKPFYIREKRTRTNSVKAERPGERTGNMPYEPTEYADGKRYRVLRTSISEPELENTEWVVTASFETAELPFAESVGTTMSLHTNGINAVDELWSHGMGLSKDPSTWVYKYTNTPKFSIYNAGDLAIDDFLMYRVIKIKLAQTASSFELIDPTGGIFKVSAAFKSGDEVVIDGFRVKGNGVNILSNTNKYFPVILPKQNTFEVKGITAFTIEFDFRFYYGSSDISRFTSTDVNVVAPKDTTPPPQPTIDTVYGYPKNIRGTAEAGSTVTVTAGQATVTTKADINGAYTAAIPSTATNSITQGTTVTAKATDDAGNTGPTKTITVAAFPSTPPTIRQTDSVEGRLVFDNCVLGKRVRWEVYDASGNFVNTYLSPPAANANMSFGKQAYMTAGTTIKAWTVDENTQERISVDAVPMTVSLLSSTETSSNQWRSSNKDYTNLKSSAGMKKITENFTIVFNPEFNAYFKTSGDSIIMVGNPGDLRFYYFHDLKPNTTYTLSYLFSYTFKAQPHTHSWGIGYLNPEQSGTRKGFTFTTNANGQYGYGYGATMDPPASSILNAMNVEAGRVGSGANENLVKYEQITLNEGTTDRGYTAGIPTSVPL